MVRRGQAFDDEATQGAEYKCSTWTNETCNFIGTVLSFLGSAFPSALNMPLIGHICIDSRFKYLSGCPIGRWEDLGFKIYN